MVTGHAGNAEDKKMLALRLQGVVRGVDAAMGEEGPSKPFQESKNCREPLEAKVRGVTLIYLYMHGVLVMALTIT